MIIYWEQNYCFENENSILHTLFFFFFMNLLWFQFRMKIVTNSIAILFIPGMESAYILQCYLIFYFIFILFNICYLINNIKFKSCYRLIDLVFIVLISTQGNLFVIFVFFYYSFGLSIFLSFSLHHSFIT